MFYRVMTSYQQAYLSFLLVFCSQSLYTGEKGKGETSMSKKKRPKQTAHPHWQPISMLPTLATHIDGMLEAAQEQYETLQLARAKPHVLDNYTVNRVIEVFTVQKNDLWLFNEQLSRWQGGTLSTDQSQEVERLIKQMQRLHEVITDILTLADELAKGTIEKVMAKSDEELGLELLMRMMKGKE
jgi:hypothetical protein